MVKKVLFFDIDGTLLNSELKIPEGVKKELKRLKDAGHYLFVASGRPLAFISIFKVRCITSSLSKFVINFS